MSTLKALVTFELDGERELPMFKPVHRPLSESSENHSVHESIHEALCRAIHEHDLEAIQYLTDIIQDISVEQVIAV